MATHQRTGAWNDAKAEMREQAGALSETVRDYAATAQEQAGQAYERATESLRDGYQRTEEYVREQPGVALTIALGVGVLAGLAVGFIFRR